MRSARCAPRSASSTRWRRCRLRSGQRLAVRIGISTGLVVVADVADTGDPRNLDIFGETPNLAARLQALAEPGTALLSDSVRRQVGALFDIRDLGRIR